MTLIGTGVGIGAILVGILAAFLLRSLRSVRLQLIGLALVAVILPLGAVLISGLVMFHMGDDADFIFITGAVTSIGLLCAFLLARNLVNPLENIRSASQRLAAGDLSARAPEGGPAELAELGASFNLMAAHLEETFDARRELVAWASHDLRAPITSLQAMLEAIEDGIVEPAHYLSPLQSQVRLLGALVDDLFDLACIDSGAVNLEYDVVELESLVSSCVHRFDAEARARRIRVTCLRRGGSTQSRCAADKVERVLTNLLTERAPLYQFGWKCRCDGGRRSRSRLRLGGGHRDRYLPRGGRPGLRAVLASRRRPLLKPRGRRPRSGDRPGSHRSPGRADLGGATS